MNTGNITLAIEIFRALAYRNPAYSNAYYNLGLAYQEAKNYPKAGNILNCI